MSGSIGASLCSPCWEAPVDAPRPSKETGPHGGSGCFSEAFWHRALILKKRKGQVLGARGLWPRKKKLELFLHPDRWPGSWVWEGVCSRVRH